MAGPHGVPLEAVPRDGRRPGGPVGGGIQPVAAGCWLESGIGRRAAEGTTEIGMYTEGGGVGEAWLRA